MPLSSVKQTVSTVIPPATGREVCHYVARRSQHCNGADGEHFAHFVSLR
jgi:hypothetical protein